MAGRPVLSLLLRVALINIAIEHFVVVSIKVTDLLIVIIQEQIACREFEPFGCLIVSPQPDAPTVCSLRVVASPQFTFQ